LALSDFRRKANFLAFLPFFSNILISEIGGSSFFFFLLGRSGEEVHILSGSRLETFFYSPPHGLSGCPVFFFSPLNREGPSLPFFLLAENSLDLRSSLSFPPFPVFAFSLWNPPFFPPRARTRVFFFPEAEDIAGVVLEGFDFCLYPSFSFPPFIAQLRGNYLQFLDLSLISSTGDGSFLPLFSVGGIMEISSK